MKSRKNDGKEGLLTFGSYPAVTLEQARKMRDEAKSQKAAGVERYDLIEHQLAHMVRAPNGRVYNRTQHLPERRRIMERWANYLDELRVDVAVVA